MRPGTKDQKSIDKDSKSSQPSTPSPSPAREKERELFKRLGSVKKYPISPDETPEQ